MKQFPQSYHNPNISGAEFVMGEFSETVRIRLQKKLHNPSDFGGLGLTILVLTSKPARLDLYGLGDGTILANSDKIIETQEMVK